MTLYQLTIGSLPFEGECDDDVLRKHVMERLSSPELKSRGHSPHLHYFIEKMMSKDADLRYQSWDEALKDVREQVEGRASLDFKASAGRGRGRGRGTGIPQDGDAVRAARAVATDVVEVGTSGAVDPGLGGVVPFRFSCHRCGHCCTGGEGHVWLRLARSRRWPRRFPWTTKRSEGCMFGRFPDPSRAGELRETLRERQEGAGGRCTLLEGQNQCTVYEARPEHCRTFPYWTSVMEDESGFERARATCPGIRVEATAEQRTLAFARLEAVYDELEELLAAVRPVCIARGVCCRFEEADHVLYATGLEADYAASKKPQAPPPEAEGRCPYHVEGRCTARKGRPLGCRTYYCDPAMQQGLEAHHERLLGEIRTIERDLGYPASYAPFPELLLDRGVGREGHRE